MTDESFGFSVPLDADGFLRRECPTCEREFKWLHIEDEDATPAPDGGYFCPYCAIQAPPGDWLTPAQLELAHNVLAREALSPMMKKLDRDLRRSSGPMIKLSLSYEAPPAMDPLVEENDMRRIESACHPAEPVKVLDDWDRAVHCLMCGAPVG